MNNEELKEMIISAVQNSTDTHTRITSLSILDSYLDEILTDYVIYKKETLAQIENRAESKPLCEVTIDEIYQVA